MRFLNLNSPPGFEQYFRDLAEALSGGPIDPAIVAEIVRKYYDIEPAALVDDSDHLDLGGQGEGADACGRSRAPGDDHRTRPPHLVVSGEIG